MATINIQETQNLMDVALQEYGSLEAFFGLLEENNIYEVSQDLSVYEPLQINNVLQNATIVNYYKSINHRPATYATAEEICLDGIGCMSINDTFLVR